ncbi:MAG: hypothetical protein ACE5KF_05685 [Kiloniellaceae bacterium]
MSPVCNPSAATRLPLPGPVAILLLPFLLAACAAFGEAPQRPCPQAVAVPDANELVRFGGPGRDLTDVLFEARIEDIGLVCEYDGNVVEASLRLRILAVHGPADAGRQANFRYFVAIVTRDQRIVAREEFGLKIPFPGNRTRVAAVEELAPRIPLRPGQSGADYLIYVGLDVTADELRYNRENR